VRKSKLQKKLLYGEYVVPEDWDVATGPRLDGIAAASMPRAWHGSRSTTIFDEPGGWACGQAVRR
jgi:hypothetical protein